jgi:AcrR family transcriptional regulator
VTAVVQACRLILKKEGPEALNTNYIAEVAGVNIASLYRWFENKVDVIRQVFEELVKEDINELLSLLKSPVDSKEVIRIDDALLFLIDPLINRQIEFLSLHQCFYQDNQSDFDVGKRPFLDSNLSWIEAASQWLASVIQHYYPQRSLQDCDFQAFMISRAVQGLCLSAATDHPEYLRLPRFKDEMLVHAKQYLVNKNNH